MKAGAITRSGSCAPAEIRDILDLKDQCMVSFGGGEISIAPGASMTFWELARFAKIASLPSRAENISGMIDLNPKLSPRTSPSNRRFNSNETRSTPELCSPTSAVSHSTVHSGH